MAAATAFSRSNKPVQTHTVEDAALQAKVNADPKMVERGLRINLWHETAAEGVSCCALIKLGGKASPPVKQSTPFDAKELVESAVEWHERFINRLDERDPWSSDPDAAYGGWPSDLR